MRSRWNDAEASQLQGLDLLVYASRLVGAETSLVIWGGGNTSIKTRERDHRGREIPVLRVKGSGSDLKSVQRKDFPGVRMDDIAALLERTEMSDEEMVSYLAHALQEPGGVRPSIETLLHGFLPAPAIVHTHADAVVSLTNNDRAHDVLQGVYGKDVIALGYRRPGFKISRDVADAIAERPDAKALLLERHGTITWGATVREAYEATVLAYGGLDILVSNAGIAHSAPVVRLELADWERSFAVNSTGHFIVAREAMRLMTAQGLGGALVFVATKNVMSPGKDFAAYSAAKAAEAQLAKVLALEGAPYGIRSNIVNPDAVFQDSKLWSDEIRRERAAAQGITVDRLEDFYRKRNLLGVGILPEDVAEAVLFLASDRAAKTTGCSVTVDGGVRDAFPR